MSNYKFLFDLDSTLTRKEILPTISEVINRKEEMQNITEKTMLGDIPFEASFKARVEILKDIPVSRVRKMAAEIPLMEDIIRFINENKDRCYIVTSNLDVWIIELMKKIGMENNFYSSRALVENDKIKEITSILCKENKVQEMDGNIIAIGDGNNDAEMIKSANIGIGFGGVRPIAPSVLEVATYAVYDEKKLCELLRRFL